LALAWPMGTSRRSKAPAETPQATTRPPAHLGTELVVMPLTDDIGTGETARLLVSGETGAGFQVMRLSPPRMGTPATTGETARTRGLGGLLYAFTKFGDCPGTCEGELVRVVERPLAKTSVCLMIVEPGLAGRGLCQ